MTLEEEGKAKAIDKNHILKGRSIGEIIISLLSLSLSRQLMGFSRSSNFTDKKKLAFLVDNHNHNIQEEEGEEDHHRSKFLSTSPFMASTSSNSTINKAIFNNNQTNPLDHHHHQHINIPNYGINMQSSSSSSIGNFISKDNMGSGNNSTNHGAYDLGELDQALFLYLDGQQADASTTSNHLHQDQRHQNTSGMRPPTLNIFPSQPMHVHPSSTKASTGLAVSSSQGGSMSGSKRGSDHPILLSNNMDLVNNSTTATTSTSITRNDITTTTALSASPSAPDNHNNQPATANKAIKREGNRKGPTSSSEQEGPKTPDPKTLRRLAQNREAARKSRLRKKAYVQQLESSRIKLTQIEQELQRARSQGMFFGGGAALLGGEQGIPVGIGNISPDAAVFDMEYARWLEEHHRIMCELRAAVQEHIPENELRIFVDNCLAHHDQFFSLKSMVAKTDVFHIVSGMWKTPAERCFMWMGGFRPSEIIKIILSQIEPLTEQQILGICGLQQSTQEAEEALSQGLEALNQSLSDTIAADSLSCPPNMTNYMGQMALAMSKLSTLEGFVRQADNLRQQTIHRMQQILTTRQAARCLLAIAEYFHRLRALSSLWLARPRQDQ